MKVANITMHAINNYGSVLQALATEKLFQELGCEVITIDYIKETAQLNSICNILKYGGPSLKLKCKQLVFYLFFNDKKKLVVFEKFRKKYLHLTSDKYMSDNDLYKNPPIADVYCTGSDQTWNVEYQGGIPYAYFLDFVPQGKRKIAFSASFGIESIQDKYKNEVKELLKKYYAISVREATGVKIVNELGLEATQVLDPTLVVERKFWDSLASKRLIEDDYLFIYQLNSNKQFENYANKYAHKKALHIVYMKGRKCKSYNDAIYYQNPSPEDFLSLIKYAKFVITDSFHATVFCLMLHTNFIDIFPQLYSTRLKSILKLTNLESRKLVDYNSFDQFDKPINFDKTDLIIEQERKVTMSFLVKNLY